MLNLKLLSRFLERLVLALDRILFKLTNPSRHSLTLSIATDLPRSKFQLIAENAFLRQQLIILLASQVRNWKDLLIILKPDTLLRWHRQGFRLFWKFKSRNRGGRPKLAPETISLIQKLAQENSLWGAERTPKAWGTSQAQYRRRHDHPQKVFASEPSNPSSQPNLADFPQIPCSRRRVVHFNVTTHPTDAWVAQQLREATPFGQSPRFLIRDRDRKYGQGFAAVAKGSQIEILKTPYRAPKANAICERFLGSVRRECLDHMLILGESHLYRVIEKYVEFFNQARPVVANNCIRQRLAQN